MAAVPLVLTLPYPPTANTYYRSVKGRVLISAAGRRYRKDVLAIVFPLRLKPLTGRLVVEVDAYMPDNRQRDIDNLQKSLLDSLQHAGVYLRD